ncbi:MAG: STM4504/CBY_0614 family protein [Hydrogenophaga sp.]|uniref:STM4504/CBY_0614 family protein n=1 Tax=Hydrogenophaga sp. TaxID=1904254 RepID=UPI003D0C77BC
MTILDLFSKRQKKLRKEVPDVYTYSVLPGPLRTQIIHIWFDALGSADQYFGWQVKPAYEFIVQALCREYGIFRLPPARDYGQRNFLEELVEFLLNVDDTEQALDVVELSFRLIDHGTRKFEYLGRNDFSKIADAAISELNTRFLEHGVGFQYSNSEIIRIDSELLHVEVVKPLLCLLNGKHYAGAQQEFLKAHEHYRKGNSKEALNECLKAFESLMKAICDKKRWTYSKTAPAKDLIQVCLDNGLIPSFWQSHYGSLRSILESGVPTGRNRLGGHGQGSTPTVVPNYLVSYMLHMTASAMLFLAEAEVALP